MSTPTILLAQDLADDDALRRVVTDDGFHVIHDAAGLPAGIELVRWESASRERLLSVIEPSGRPAWRLVVVLDRSPTPHAARTLKARVAGVVMAEDVAHGLAPTLRAVAAGQSSHPLSWHEILDRPLLSNREKQVLAMVVLGLSNGEIAAKLNVTESNVKFHLTSAFGKLGVNRRDEATSLILDPDAGLGPGILRIVPEKMAADQR